MKVPNAMKDCIYCVLLLAGFFLSSKIIDYLIAKSTSNKCPNWFHSKTLPNVYGYLAPNQTMYSCGVTRIGNYFDLSINILVRVICDHLSPIIQQVGHRCLEIILWLPINGIFKFCHIR